MAKKTDQVSKKKKRLQLGIMHGHSKDWRQVKTMVQEFGYTPRALIEEYKAVNIFEHLRDIVWNELHGVVVVMTADDTVKGKKSRARQNVIFELGYCFGAFDSQEDEYAYSALVILREKGVETFSDIHGLKVIEFERGKVKAIKPILEQALAEVYENAREFYSEDF
jgi:predicted nucleotide-binding protein